jgi:hypothetical protein
MRLVCLLFISAASFAQTGTILGTIEFFGDPSIDAAKLRAQLPVREGEPSPSPEIEDAIIEAVRTATGKPPSDVAGVCCDDQGQSLLFIGLGGRTTVYNPTPAGKSRLPRAAIGLNARFEGALIAAIQNNDASEDRTQGYSLMKNPEARAIQLDMRRWALRNEASIRRALRTSADAHHREVAAMLMGYARQSSRQIQDLLHAARDPEDGVRNNATRALAVMAASGPKLARKIPADIFIDMIQSGVWLDRNKSAALLDSLTAQGDERILRALRDRALNALIEMAAWRRPSHASAARTILERVRALR